jgi:hypothetical protein
MARSRNKHSRAALRAKARRPRRQGSSRWFVVTVTLLTIAGLVGVVFAADLFDRDGSSASAAPQPPSADNPSGDHWHAALGVNVCGEWLESPAEFETAAGNSGVRTGIHTHGDGFIHIHPFYGSEAGANATLGKFLDYGGWSASEDAIEVWTGPSFDPQKTTWSNGDRCPDDAPAPGRGHVVFEVNCKTVTGDPSDHKLRNQEVVAIGFVPADYEIGAPPNASSAPANDGTDAEAIDQKKCRPSADNNPGVTATAPSSATTPDSATTATTAPVSPTSQP